MVRYVEASAGDVKRLAGSDEWLLWVGDRRVRFTSTLVTQFS